MNPKTTFTFTLNYTGTMGDARLIITRRRKLDRAANGTGPKQSKDVRHSDVLYMNMSYSTTVVNASTHENKYVCTAEVKHSVLRKLRTRSDADLSPDNLTRKNILCMCFIVTNSDGEIIAKVSQLLTA